MVNLGMRRLALVLLCALAAAGCSDTGGRLAVSGKVTLKGQPLNDGNISFEPIGETASAPDATRAGAPILAGAYSIDAEHGLLPGKYRVSMTAGDGVTPAEAEIGAPGGSTNIVSKDRIPPEFGVNSQQEVTVAAEGPNTFDFTIP